MKCDFKETAKAGFIFYGIFICEILTRFIEYWKITERVLSDHSSFFVRARLRTRYRCFYDSGGKKVRNEVKFNGLFIRLFFAPLKLAVWCSFGRTKNMMCEINSVAAVSHNQVCSLIETLLCLNSFASLVIQSKHTITLIYRKRLLSLFNEIIMQMVLGCG